MAYPFEIKTMIYCLYIYSFRKKGTKEFTESLEAPSLSPACNRSLPIFWSSSTRRTAPCGRVFPVQCGHCRFHFLFSKQSGDSHTVSSVAPSPGVGTFPLLLSRTRNDADWAGVGCGDTEIDHKSKSSSLSYHQDSFQQMEILVDFEGRTGLR